MKSKSSIGMHRHIAIAKDEGERVFRLNRIGRADRFAICIQHQGIAAIQDALIADAGQKLAGGAEP